MQTKLLNKLPNNFNFKQIIKSFEYIWNMPHTSPKGPKKNDTAAVFSVPIFQSKLPTAMSKGVHAYLPHLITGWWCNNHLEKY